MARKTQAKSTAIGQWQAVWRDPAGLLADPRNARQHSDAQVAMIRRSIDTFGFNVPITVDDFGVVKTGEGRWRASMLDPPLESVPTVPLSHLTEAQQRAFMIADNKIGERSKWNETMLQMEVADLASLGVDVSVLGLASTDLDRMLRPEFNDIDETAPALPDVPVTRRGDLWICDGHRIICGDATDAGDVGALLDGAKPHLMVTDPPYGVDYDPSWREGAGLSDGSNLATGKVLNDKRADWSEAWRLFPGAVAYVWHGALHNVTVAQSLMACGFQIRAQIVWIKQRAAISRGAYHWAHEPAFYAVQEGEDDHWRFEDEHEGAAYAVQGGATARWRGGRRQSTVWEIQHMRNDTGHGTQKPMECMRRPILNNSVKGDAVYEPFSGSGTTLVACEQTERRCFASELDPRYVDVAVKRWETMTGASATRLSDGASFKDLKPDGEARPAAETDRAEKAGGKSRSAAAQRKRTGSPGAGAVSKRPARAS